MKKHLLTYLLALPASIFFAQPIITSADLLKVGDIVVTQPCATTAFTPGSAGANQTWDFSQLISEGPQDTTFYILPAGTPYAETYPSSNIVGRFGRDSYGYYQTTGDRLFFWGQKDPTSAITFTDPAVYYQSPATYGTSVLDTIAGSLSTGPFSGTLTGRVFFQGDGYGTLHTPGGQYTNVLRLKTVTVALATIPFLGTITDSVFNYSWYQLGVKSPVLEMIEDTQWANGAVVSQKRYVNYFRSLTTSKAIEPNAADVPLIQVFPNPTNGQVQFSGLEYPARIIVRNTTGQVVLEDNIMPNDRMDVSHLGAGIYVCSISGDTGATQWVKFIVR